MLSSYKGKPFLGQFWELEYGNSGNRKFTGLYMKFVPHNSRKMLVSTSVFQGGENRVWLTQPSVGFFISHFCYWVWLKILKLLKCRKQMVLGPAIEQKTFRRDTICGTQRPCSPLLHLVSFCISPGLLSQKQKKWTPSVWFFYFCIFLRQEK